MSSENQFELQDVRSTITEAIPIDFIDSISEFKNQFSAGTLLGKSIANHLNGVKGKDFDDISTEIRTQFETLRSRFENKLNTIGLTMELVDSDGSYLSSIDQTNWQGSEIRLNVSDGTHFVEFLSGFHSESVTPDETASLKFVFDMLTLQVMDGYDLTDAEDDRLHNLFGCLGSVVGHIRRIEDSANIGLHALGANLISTYEAVRSGYIIEYVKAKEMELDYLLDNPLSLIESSLKHGQHVLEDFFNATISTFSEIYKNEKARDLYDKLMQDLILLIESMEKEINTWLGATDMPSGTTSDLTQAQVDEFNADVSGSRWEHFFKKKAFLEIINKAKYRLVDF